MMDSLKHTALQIVNQRYHLYHSGVRLVGCGKSLMFQLQSRVWGLGGEGGAAGDAVAASFPYPVTAPDNHQMRNSLSCEMKWPWQT